MSLDLRVWFRHCDIVSSVALIPHKLPFTSYNTLTPRKPPFTSYNTPGPPRVGWGDRGYFPGPPNFFLGKGAHEAFTFLGCIFTLFLLSLSIALSGLNE